MEWQIKTISRKSTLSKAQFEPGDIAISLIFKESGGGEIGRADLLEGEVENFDLPGDLLGRWRRVIKEPDEESVNATETLASAEDFFFSLFENTSADSVAESDMLKHLLALMLERKRVLRVVGSRKSSGEQIYRHVKTKQEVTVPIREMSRELMMNLQDTIGELML